MHLTPRGRVIVTSDQPATTADVLREIADRLGVDLDVVTLLHPTAREAHDLDPFIPKDAA